MRDNKDNTNTNQSTANNNTSHTGIKNIVASNNETPQKGNKVNTKNKTGKNLSVKILKDVEAVIKKVKNNMYPHRASPQFIHEIYSRNTMANELLKRAISNAFRHDLNVRPGHLNNADGNCLWEALIYNILYRPCIKRKTKENHRQLRKRSLEKAYIDAQNKKLPFIPAHNAQADWDHIKRD